MDENEKNPSTPVETPIEPGVSEVTVEEEKIVVDDEPMMEPVDVVAEPVAEPTVEPAVEQAQAESVQEPASEPVAEPVQESATEAAPETVATPAPETVVAPEPSTSDGSFTPPAFGQTVAEANEIKAKKAGKKSKTPLIVGGVVVLAALGGGGAFAYTQVTSPENTLLSAMDNFLKAEDMKVTGTFEAKPSADVENPVKSVKITLSEKAKGVKANETTATMTVNYNDNDISVELGSVVINDYTIYVKIDQLKGAYDRIKNIIDADSKKYTTNCMPLDYDPRYYDTDDAEGIADAEEDADDLEDGSMTSNCIGYQTSYGLGMYLESFDDFISDFIGKIDGQWWKIKVEDIVDQLGDMIDSGTQKQVKAAWNCLTDELEREYKGRNRLADYYKNNSFLELKEAENAPSALKNDGKVWKVSVNTSKLAGFANEAVKGTDTSYFVQCLEDSETFSTSEISEIRDSLDTTKVKEIKADDIEKYLDLSKVKFYAATDGLFSHTLKGIHISASDDDATFTGTLHFSYDAVNVSAPSDAKEAKDFVEIVTETLSGLMEKFGGSDYDYDYNYDDNYDVIYN